jgi:hypothetical protein
MSRETNAAPSVVEINLGQVFETDHTAAGTNPLVPLHKSGNEISGAVDDDEIPINLRRALVASGVIYGKSRFYCWAVRIIIVTFLLFIMLMQVKEILGVELSFGSI